jgi:prepilin-type N-terminal cleavage/methylation domain-containing protein
MPTPRTSRGFSLLELMIALAILMGALVGLLKLQIVGVTSNNAGRMQTVANEAAIELAGALERQAFGDIVLLAPTSTNGPTTPTAGFGPLVSWTGSIDTSVAHDFTATPVPTVRSDAELGPQYKRYWTVWGYSPTAGGTPTVKVISVSVVWTQPGMSRPGEATVLTQLPDPSFVINNALTAM